MTAVLLFQLIDVQRFGFGLNRQLPIEAQTPIVSLESLSFQSAHAKLSSLLEPFEAVANADLQSLLGQPTQRSALSKQLLTSSSGDRLPEHSYSTSFTSGRLSEDYRFSETCSFPALRSIGASVDM